MAHKEYVANDVTADRTENSGQRRPDLSNIIKSAGERAVNGVLQKSASVKISTEQPPAPLENRWASEQLAAELFEIEKTKRSAEDKEKVDKKRQKRQGLGRTNQVKMRLTDAELVRLQRRVDKAGTTQGEFLRRAALEGQIVIRENNVADVVIDELELLRGELGRQGGLLKMVIKPNEGQRELNPGEWNELISAVREMETLKRQIASLEVKLTHGNR